MLFKIMMHSDNRLFYIIMFLFMGAERQLNTMKIIGSSIKEAIRHEDVEI